MVHKIKPRLSAAQRLPSGSHVVEACWECARRGQVNAPPPPPPPPLPRDRRPRPPPAGRQRGLRLPDTHADAPGEGGRPGGHHRAPTPRGSPAAPHAPTPTLSGCTPVQDLGAPLLPSRLPGCGPRFCLHPASLSPCRISWGAGLSVRPASAQSLSSPPPAPHPRPASLCLGVCPSLTPWLSQVASVRPSASPASPAPPPASPPAPLSRRWRPPHCSAAPAVYDKNIILLLLNNPINLSTGRKLTSCLFG